MKPERIVSLVLIILLLVSISSPVASAVRTKVMKFNSQGPQVKELQSRLRQIGYYYGPQSGIYGPLTENSIIRFQKDYGLRIDGVAGQETINKLYSLEEIDYWVQSGDSWFELAQRFNQPIWKLQNRNNLYTNKLRVGQRLKIPVNDVDRTSIQRVSSNTEGNSYNLSSQEFDLLARAVYSESRGEPYSGQVAVASVILNRVEDPRFPNTIRGVVFEPWAFTAVHDGQFWFQPDATSRQAVRDALQGWDPSGGAVFYYNPAQVTSYWIFSRTAVNQIGNHIFAI